MDKPVWEQIREDAKSFGEVLELASKFIAIDRKAITYARAIDVNYESKKKFTLHDWIRLHDIGVSLWYKQYIISYKSFKVDTFINEFLPPYQENINLLLQTTPRFIQLQDDESLKHESLHTWKLFIANIAYLSNQEQLAGKKQKKFQLNTDTQFGILVIVALIIGMSLAIAVSLLRR